MHVVHPLGLPRARRGAADSPVKGNGEAPVAALVGTNFKEPRRDYPIKACPIGLGQGVVHLAGYGSHKGDGVKFARAEGV